MKTSADGAEYVSAIQLAGGEEIERSGEKADPGGAANGMEEKNAGGRAVVKNRSEETQQKRSAEDDIGVRGIDDAGGDLGVKEPKNERGNGKDETNQRTGSANVEKRARGADGRTNQDERTEGANDRREGNEKRVAGMNVMMAASEEMAELVSEKNDQESGSERQTSDEAGRILVKESEGAKEIVERDGLIVGVGDGELRASGEASTERQEKEEYGEKKRFEGRPRKNRNVVPSDGRKIAPVNGVRERAER